MSRFSFPGINWTLRGVLLGVAFTSVTAASLGQEREPVLERCLVSLIEEAQVPAREAGVLVELNIREGDVVSMGDIIAGIDDSQPEFDRRKAIAEHAQAQAKADSDVDVRYAISAEEVAKAEYDKANESNKRVPGSVTRVELDRLQLTWKRGELQIEQAQMERKLSSMAVQSQEVDIAAAEAAIDRRKIRSPLDGMVVQVYPHLGEWMQPGDPLARVVRTDSLRVEGYVDSAEFEPEQVRDRPVTVIVNLAGERTETFAGRIVYVSPLVEPGGDYRVWAEAENRKPDGSNQWLLRPGQTATMTIHAGKPALPPVHRTQTTAQAY
jgi:multidrug efflux pump subunit AcrA (membrane-fusion protein)